MPPPEAAELPLIVVFAMCIIAEKLEMPPP
jgi:hypothetical protein